MISERRRSGTTPAPPHQAILAWWCFPSPIVSGGTYAQKVTFLPNPHRELAMRLENDFSPWRFVAFQNPKVPLGGGRQMGEVSGNTLYGARVYLELGRSL